MQHRIARGLAVAAATGLLALGVAGTAHAAPGDVWTGNQVVDVIPAATTQTNVLGLMSHYTGGGQDLYLWNAVRMVRDSTGHESWVFCIQQAQAGSAGTYVVDPTQAGTAAARAHADQINRVLADATFPAPGSLHVTAPDPTLASVTNDVLPADEADHLEMTAVQFAIWHYSDGLDFTTSNTSIAKQFYPASFTGTGGDVTMSAILARYDTLVADADAHPLPNPVPTVTVAPATAKTTAGKALVFTVTGTDIDGSLTVTSSRSGLPLHPVAAGGTCTTGVDLTTLPAGGGKVCVLSHTVTSVVVSASGQSAPTTTQPLYAFGAQGVIATGPSRASASAKGSWTAPTAVLPTTVTKTPTTSPVAVKGVKISGTAVLPEQLAATGPSALRTQGMLAALAIALGALLLLLTRRRVEPLAVGAEAVDPTTPGTPERGDAAAWLAVAQRHLVRFLLPEPDDYERFRTGVPPLNDQPEPTARPQSGGGPFAVHGRRGAGRREPPAPLSVGWAAAPAPSGLQPSCHGDAVTARVRRRWVHACVTTR